MLDLLQTYGVYYLIGQYPNGPLGGLALTFLLAAAGLILALPVGIVLGLCRVSPIAVLRWPATAIVYVVRGTPLLMVIFWAYFLLPSITGQRTDQFSTMLTALVIFDGAYLAEIVRAGILAVSHGQTEASYAVGLRPNRTLQLVIVPQALRVIIPPLTSQYLNLTKNSSLAIAIGYMDVFATIGGISLMQTGKEMETMIIVMGVYLVISLTVSAFMNWFNRKMKLKER